MSLGRPHLFTSQFLSQSRRHNDENCDPNVGETAPESACKRGVSAAKAAARMLNHDFSAPPGAQSIHERRRA